MEKVSLFFPPVSPAGSNYGLLRYADWMIRLFSMVLSAIAAVQCVATTVDRMAMRVDLIHTGTASEERFQLDGIYNDGKWSGPSDKTEDRLNLGMYFYEVRDSATGRILYSRGFASIFGEWELTDEAKQQRKSFSESVRFPFPATPVKLAIKKRDKENVFREIWSGVVEPEKAIKEDSQDDGTLWEVVTNGPAAHRVDLLLLGDGYTRAELEKWHNDAKRIAGYLFWFLRFGSVEATSMSGLSTHRPPQAAFLGRRMASRAHPPRSHL